MRFGFRSFRYWFLLSLVGILLCLPVVSVSYAPLVDYPNHLARAYVLLHYDEIPSYKLMYTRLFEPIPNLAVDLILPVLLRFVDILIASKIFLVITVVIFVTGCHRLGKAIHGRPTWLALPCCFFVYSHMFLNGFVNYIFGVGLFCIALAYWIERREKWSAATLLLSSALIFCTYLAHLSAYFFLGVSLVVVELWNYRARESSLRSALVSLSPLAPSLVAFVAFMYGSGDVGRIQWDTAARKLFGALALVGSYDYTLDVLLAAGSLITIVMVASRVRRFGVVRPLFTTGVIFAIFYLMCPSVMFTSYVADKRFILPAALLLVLALKIEMPENTGKVLLLIYLVMASVHIGAIWKRWAALDGRIAAEVDRLMILPEGASVYPVFRIADDLEEANLERSFGSIVHYATIYRHAFVPTLFARRGQQPLLFRSNPRFAPPSYDAEQWVHNLADYDYAWSYGISADLRGLLAARGTVISESDGFALWKLDNAISRVRTRSDSISR